MQPGTTPSWQQSSPLPALTFHPQDGIQEGVFLVDTMGNYYPGGVEEDQLRPNLWLSAVLSIYYYSGGEWEGKPPSEPRGHFSMLDLGTCRDRMLLAPGAKIIGWLDTAPIPSAQPPTPTVSPTPEPTPTEAPGTAWLSGVVYPYATDCTGGECPSCGAVDVYAVDSATGTYYHTFVEDWPCRYSLEVPAPATYTVAALTRRGLVCGTYLDRNRLDDLAYGRARVAEPSSISVLPGDRYEDLHVPLYLGPSEWPRGLTCAFIPVDTPPDLLTITVENPNCVPYDLRIGERVITIPSYQSVAFGIPAGTCKTTQCYADTGTCLEPQSYYWERDDRISLQWITRDCPLTDSSPFSMWVESLDGCQVTINGVTQNRSIQGPWAWRWGDGSILTGCFPQTHTYASAGEYGVEVTAPYLELPASNYLYLHIGNCP